MKKIVLKKKNSNGLLNSSSLNKFFKNQNNKTVVIVGLVCISLVAIIIGVALGLKGKVYKEVSVICNNTSKSAVTDSNPAEMIHTEFVGTNKHGLYISNYNPSKMNNVDSFNFKSLKSIFNANPPKKVTNNTLNKLNSAHITAIADYVTISADKKTNNEIFVGTKNNGLFSVSMQASGIDNYSITNIVQITNDSSKVSNVSVTDFSQIVSLNILRKDNIDPKTNVNNLLIQTYNTNSKNNKGGIYRYNINNDSFIDTNYANQLQNNLKLTDVPLGITYKTSIANDAVRDYSNIIFAANNYIIDNEQTPTTYDNEQTPTTYTNVLLNQYNYATEDLSSSTKPFGQHVNYTYSNKNDKQSKNVNAKKILTISKNIDISSENSNAKKILTSKNIDTSYHSPQASPDLFAPNLGFSVGYEVSGLFTSFAPYNEGNLSLKNVNSIVPKHNKKYPFQDNTTISSLDSKYNFSSSNDNHVISSIHIAVCYGNNFSYVSINPSKDKTKPNNLEYKTLNVNLSTYTSQIFTWVTSANQNNTALGFLGTEGGLKLLLTKTSSSDDKDYSIISKSITLH